MVKKTGEQLTLFYFLTKNFQGQLTEYEECRPQWWDINQIPLDKIWEDDQSWLHDAL